MNHALLSPSSANRWLICTPSAKLGAKYPNKSSVYADEGTCAHSLCELLLQKALGLITNEKYKSDLTVLKKSEYYDLSMLSYAKDYRDYVLEQYNRLVAQKKGKVYIKIECRVDLTNYVPGSFGTSDCFIYNDEVLIVIDFKYGKGVEVSPIKNYQFRLYAIGIIGQIYDKAKIELIEMHVYQPRMNNIGYYSETRSVLVSWYKSDVLKQAQLAYQGKGEYKAGKHCGFCPAKGNCKTYAQFNLSNIDESFALPNGLDPEFITKVVLNAGLFESWIKSVKAFALEQAQKGVKFPGLKLVEGRSNRYIDSPDYAALELIMNGAKESDVYKPKTLHTITELEKTIGKSQLNELIGDYILKPDGAPTLVSEDDKRIEIDKSKALKSFADLIEK